MNSIVHSSFISCFAILFLTQNISQDRWRSILRITRGYFFYDIVCVILFSTVSESSQQALFFILHHLALLLAIFFLDQYPRTMAIGFLAEIPIPFLSAFLYLHEWQATDAPLYYPLGISAIALYFIFRVCNLTYLFVSRLQMRQDNMRTKAVVTIPILLLNYYWFYVMIREAFKVLYC